MQQLKSRFINQFRDALAALHDENFGFFRFEAFFSGVLLYQCFIFQIAAPQYLDKRLSQFLSNRLVTCYLMQKLESRFIKRSGMPWQHWIISTLDSSDLKHAFPAYFRIVLSSATWYIPLP